MASRRRAHSQNQAQNDYSAREAQLPFDTNAQQRAEQALHLRVMGYSWQEVAKRCGYKDHTGALKAVKKLRSKLVLDDVRDAIAMQYMRIERAIVECMEFMEQQPPEDRLWAIDRLVPLLKRQAELMGLDAPKDAAQTAQMVIVGVPEAVAEAV